MEKRRRGEWAKEWKRVVQLPSVDPRILAIQTWIDSLEEKELFEIVPRDKAYIEIANVFLKGHK